MIKKNGGNLGFQYVHTWRANAEGRPDTGGELTPIGDPTWRGDPTARGDPAVRGFRRA